MAEGAAIDPAEAGTGAGAAAGAAQVTVVIAAWNAADTIERAIHSAVRSSVPARVVVVDDGSTDATAARLAELGRALPITVIAQANAGLGAARAAGAAAVETRYLAFLDADDECAPARLERQLAAARQATRGGSTGGGSTGGRSTGGRSTGGRSTGGGDAAGPLVISCGTVQRTPDGGESRKCCFATPGGVADISQAFLDGKRLPSGASILMATADYRAIGGFDPVYRRQCEEDLLARAVAAGARFVCVPEPLYVQHVSAGSGSRQSAGRRDTYRRLFPDWTALLAATADPDNRAALIRFLRSRTLVLAATTWRYDAGTRAECCRHALRAPWPKWHERAILRLTLHLPGGLLAAAFAGLRAVRRALWR